MTVPTDLDAQIDAVVAGAPYADIGAQKFDLMRGQVQRACERNPEYRNFVRNWPIPLDQARTIEDLPYMPVTLFKSDPPLTLVAADQIKRVMLSSSTTGQTPSRVAVDTETARRMSKGVASIVSAHIGPDRRPYLVVDAAQSNQAGTDVSARGAAIRGLQPFARTTTYCLDSGDGDDLALNESVLDGFLAETDGTPVLIYGFTYILWTKFLQPLAERGRGLGLPQAFVLHSGGWKRLIEQSVAKAEFNRTAAQVVGCPEAHVIDFYGMVENLGVIYFDGPDGLKRPPAFAHVIIRSPLTFEPVAPGEVGLVQVCSLLPNSFPGHLLLTEDLGRIVSYGGPAGDVPYFEFVGRAPKTEIRGCGDVAAHRLRAAAR